MGSCCSTKSKETVEKENIIILTLEIKQKHVFRDIYFLDNIDYTDINGKNIFMII